MNISQSTIDQLQQMFTIMFFDSNANELPPNLATEIYIGYEKDAAGKVTDDKGFFINYISKTIKAKKGEITVDYVLSKINADKIYISFVEKFNSLVKDAGLHGYPTTYGIGVFVAVGYRNTIAESKLKIENLLHLLGIKFTTEYSSAGWVFRYKISKAKENIDAINKAIQ